MVTTMTTKETVEQLSQLTENIVDAIRAATDFVDKNGLQFSIYPAYGMGGTYYPPVKEGEHDHAKRHRSDLGAEPTEGIWVSSSYNCS